MKRNFEKPLTKADEYCILSVNKPSARSEGRGAPLKQKGLELPMKRILCFVFAVFLSALPLSSCLAEDAYGLYTTAVDTLDDAKSFEGTYALHLDITAGGASMGYTMDGDFQFVLHSETDVDMALDVNMDLGALMDSGEMGVSMYYVDGWMYTNANGTKEKQEVSLEELQEQMDQDDQTLRFDTLLFDREWIVTSETTKVDGGKKIYFELDGSKIYDALVEEYEKTLDTELGDLDALLGELTGDEDFNVTLGNLQYTVMVDTNNIICGESVVCPLELGEDYEIKVQMDLTDFALDSITEIDVPDDLDSYSESGDWFDDDTYLDYGSYYDGFISGGDDASNLYDAGTLF